MPVPTLACQMFLAGSARLQPVTALAPVITGCAEAAACQATVWPLVPESAAVNRSGAACRYAPSASCTTMSPDIVPLIERTAACPDAREHGWAAEQALPVPEGDA